MKAVSEDGAQQTRGIGNHCGCRKTKGCEMQDADAKDGSEETEQGLV